MHRLILKDFRSFRGRQSIPVAPLTILTGENSSGKSSFMAALAATMDPVGFPLNPGFNVPPYSLGSYDTVATAGAGDGRPAQTFSIGFEGDSYTVPATVEATYCERSGAPELKRLFAKTTHGELVVDMPLGEDVGRVVVNVNGSTSERTFAFPPSALPISRQTTWLEVIASLAARDAAHRQDSDFEHSRNIANIMSRIASSVPAGRSYSLAPVREAPRRTYSDSTGAFDSSGAHVPSLLADVGREQNAEASDALATAVREFGKSSGLFSDVRAERFGGGRSGPFQLSVNIDGEWRNLIDVGYGVGQALPVLVQCAVMRAREWLLVQQPEVHLHARAQAALGTVFAKLAMKERRFVIETHSDFIIDRIRMLVAAKEIAHANVLILYFERSADGSVVFPISIDENGNVVDPPPSYRDFFLREEVAILNRAM